MVRAFLESVRFRPFHPAHAADRPYRTIPQSVARRAQRYPGAFKDPRDGLKTQDRRPARYTDPLSATLLPGDRPVLR